MISKYLKITPATALLIEVFSVVIAVFFALAVDEWWEDLENRERAEEALVRIIDEVKENRADIVDDIAYHEQQLAKIEPVLAQLDAGDSIEPGTEVGLSVDISILSDTSWKAAQMMRLLRYFPADSVDQITGAYSLQKLYYEYAVFLFQTMGSLESHTAPKESIIRAAHHNVRFILNLERTLLRAYDEVIAAH